MNLGKDDGNQSLSGFDDMTFDDMTFDDEPLQDGFQQDNLNNISNDSGQFMQQEQEIVNNHQFQQQVQMQANYSQPAQFNQQVGGVNNKKAKKQKAPKAPKAPKPPKAPKQPKQKKTKQQNIVDAYATTPGNAVFNNEEVEKKPTNLKVVIPVVVVVIGAIVGVAALNLPKNTDKHVTLANNAPVVEEVSDNNVSGTTVVGDSTANKDKEQSQDAGMTVLKLNEPMKIGVVVNTKLEGDTEYTDHQSYLKVEYSNFVSGYDNVKTYLDEYNSEATNKINLPGKEDFYASSVGNDLVMYEVSVTVPEDFPTNDSKHKYTGLNPEFKLEIKGTEKEDALITDLYEFAIPSVYFIGDDVSDFLIGETYTLRYMTTMPMELSADGYDLYFIYTNDSKSERYGLQSLTIPKNNDVVSVSEDSVGATEDDTAETEVVDTEQVTE